MFNTTFLIKKILHNYCCCKKICNQPHNKILYVQPVGFVSQHLFSSFLAGFFTTQILIGWLTQKRYGDIDHVGINQKLIHHFAQFTLNYAGHNAVVDRFFTQRRFC